MTQEHVVVDIEGVLRIAGRMVLGDIECFEVGAISAPYFRTGHHIKAHTQKDFLELIQYQVEGVS